MDFEVKEHVQLEVQGCVDFNVRVTEGDFEVHGLCRC